MISNTVLVLTATQRLERSDTWAGFVKVRSTSFTDEFHHLERERFEQHVENERKMWKKLVVSLLFRFNMSVGTQWCIMYVIFTPPPPPKKRKETNKLQPPIFRIDSLLYSSPSTGIHSIFIAGGHFVWKYSVNYTTQWLRYRQHIFSLGNTGSLDWILMRLLV